MCFRTGVQLPSAPPTFQLIPSDNRWYLLFLSGFCNIKCCLKISVDIPVDYGFELMIHYKQGTPKAKMRKSEPPATDTGIRSSGAACAPLRRPLYQRKDGEHKCPARAWSATSRLTTRKRNTMSIWISGATRADARSKRPAPLPACPTPAGRCGCTRCSATSARSPSRTTPQLPNG